MGLQHGSKMGDMIFEGFAKDKNIIKIDHNKIHQYSDEEQSA